jgi:hypothetical protein
VDIDPAVDRRRIARHHVGGRHMPGAPPAGKDGLRSAHPGRGIGLSQAGLQPAVMGAAWRLATSTTDGERWETVRQADPTILLEVYT